MRPLVPGPSRSTCGVIGLLALLALLACSEDSTPTDPGPDPWIAFEATWPDHLPAHMFATDDHGNLYVGGRGVTRWSAEEESWEHLLGPLPLAPRALAVFGDELLVGGRSAPAETLATGEVLEIVALTVRRDDAWEEIGQLEGTVYALVVHEERLIVGGLFTETMSGLQNVVAWDGATWSPMGGEVDGSVRALYASRGDLLMGGSFTEVDGRPMRGIARWDGAAWVSTGFDLEGEIRALFLLEDRVVAAGWFKGPAPAPRFSVAIETAGGWTRLGDLNLFGHGTDVLAFRGRLYAAGGEGVFAWRGSEWERVLSGLVSDLIPFNGSLLAAGRIGPFGGSLARIP